MNGLTLRANGFRLAAKQYVSWRDKLEFPFRRDVNLQHSSGKVTDEDREIPSVGIGGFLPDCDRHLFAQNSSLILCADNVCRVRLKPDDFEHPRTTRFENPAQWKNSNLQHFALHWLALIDSRAGEG